RQKVGGNDDAWRFVVAARCADLGNHSALPVPRDLGGSSGRSLKSHEASPPKTFGFLQRGLVNYGDKNEKTKFSGRVGTAVDCAIRRSPRVGGKSAGANLYNAAERSPSDQRLLQAERLRHTG